MNQHYIYRRNIPNDVWDKHVIDNTLTHMVEMIGWEGLDAAMKGILVDKEFKDVKIEVTPDFSDEPQFREVVVTVDYKPIV